MMKKIILLISSVLAFVLPVYGEELLTLKDYLKMELAKANKMSKENFNLTSAQKTELSKLAPDSADESFTFFYAKNAESKLEKACTVVAQKGKEGPISLGVCFLPTGLIDSVTILSHEEDRGRKIAAESFLKQFKGKKVTDSFVVGTDVDGISGASKSSKAISEALRKTSYAFRTFVQGTIK